MSILVLSQIRTKSELMDMLGTFFSLPDWWGRNWDAFSDCMGDWDTSTLPSPIEIIGMDEFRKNLPEDARIFLEILDENSIRHIVLPSHPQK